MHGIAEQGQVSLRGKATDIQASNVPTTVDRFNQTQQSEVV